MASKFCFIQFIVLSLIHLISSQCENRMDEPATAYVNYYMNIKTSVDLQSMNREDTVKDQPWGLWRNDSILRHRYCELCKVRFDSNDNIYLYLFKNETSTLHGPIRIDSKHIDLDMKFNLTKEARDKYSDKEFQLNLIRAARCLLMNGAYKLSEEGSLIPQLAINLELDPETASLFPTIEKDDYFIINIVNFVDRISIYPEKTTNPEASSELDDGTFVLYPGPINWVVASHLISNYTILSTTHNEVLKN
uniref:Uncharacterized protein n=1 Tax=Tetranychus urticae TaxID=32264 RepID=T1JWA8_TETUR